MKILVVLSLLHLILFESSVCVFPDQNWATRTAREVGLNGTKLAEIAKYGGSGCIIRYGYHIYGWGNDSLANDVASAAKPVYSYFLLSALQNQLIPSLNQKIKEWQPKITTINQNLSYKDSNITWHHMANQISCYEVSDIPGTAFDYNDWLAHKQTLKKTQCAFLFFVAKLRINIILMFCIVFDTTHTKHSKQPFKGKWHYFGIPYF